MLENSRDILNIALTISVIVLTFFVGWILVYVIGIFRDVKRAISDVLGMVEKLSTVLDLVRDKIRDAAAVIPFIIKGTEKIARVVQDIRDRKRDEGDEIDPSSKTKKGKKERR